MSAPYRPPTFAAPIDLDLSRNEGRPRITEIDIGLGEGGRLTSRYPDTSNLRELISRRHRVVPERVLVTAGGDDALFRCLMAVSGGTVVSTTPSFEMIRRYSDQTGSTLLEIPWWDGDFPIGDFLDTSQRYVAVVVSPNNPTGGVIGPADLAKLADAYLLVVLDAAYVEFADEDITETALELGNVIVVRTLSKAYGLAGLRVGYALGSVETIARIGAFGSPYSVSSLSSTLACGVLGSGDDGSRPFVRKVAEERQRLISLLDGLGCAPLPSQANFVLATDVDPSWLVGAAGALGVGLRRFPDRDELSTCVRITLPGDEEAYARLESTLRSALAPEAILFDLDGVIADVKDSYRQVIIDTAARFGVGVGHEDITAMKAAGNASDDHELTRVLCAEAGINVDLATVTECFEQAYHGDAMRPGLQERERLLADPRQLAGLASRLPLGIVTARPRSDAERFLDRFGIRHLFGVVVVREDAPSKPDPAPVCLAIERLGVEHAWMLGDTPDDVAAARGAGVVPIGVAAPGEATSALSGAARIIGSVDELEEVLDVSKV